MDFNPFKKTMITLVVPGIKAFPWSMRESWRMVMQKAKVPFRWVVHKEGQPDKTAANLPSKGVVFLINDHHLFDFVSYLKESQTFGRNRDERIWTALATESVAESPFPGSQKKTETCSQLCHMVAHFDPSAEKIIRLAGSESFFCHQYASTQKFFSRKPFAQKKDSIFWSGKLTVANLKSPYECRRSLFSAISPVKGFIWRDAARAEKKISEIVKEKDSYKSIVNLPSNCPGYTANFFEILAMGACCIQHRMEVPNPVGLAEGETHLGYDAMRSETLVETCQRFLENPSSYLKIAQQGQKVCVKHHSLSVRAIQIFTALKNCLVEKNLSRENIESLDIVIEKLGKIL